MKLMLNFFDNVKQKNTYRHYIKIENNDDLESEIKLVFNKCEKLSANFYKRKVFTMKHFYIGKLNKNSTKTFYKDLDLENNDELYIEYFT